jgi:hypothetical protein
MNTRLKIICILFGFAYLYIIGEYIVTEVVPDFVAGFKAGYNAESDLADTAWDNQEIGTRKRALGNYEIYFFSAVPKTGLGSYPTTFVNLKNSSFISANVEHFRAKVVNPVKVATWIHVARAFSIFLSFFAVCILIYIPVQTYKTIRSVIKNEIFETQTIHRIRRIGYALSIIFALSVFSSFIYYSEAKALISLEDYNIVFSMKADYTFLLFGLVTLLFAEILKISHQMKIEQD